MITNHALWEQGTGGGMIQTEELGEFREAKRDAEPEGQPGVAGRQASQA